MARQQIMEVAKREFVTRGRTKGYRAITGLMVLLAIAGPIIMTLIPASSDALPAATVGIASDAPGLEDILRGVSAESYDLTLVDVRGQSADEVDAQISEGDLDVVIEDTPALVWADTEDFALSGLLNAGLNQLAATQRAIELGIDLNDLSTVFTPLEIEQRFVDVEDDDDRNVRSGVAMFGLLLTFLLPQIFGQLTMLSVIEEKSTRIVEVLLSQIRPRTLLIGKILGLCALAVVQLVLIVIGLVGALLATKVVDVPASVWQFVPLLAISVLGGLAMYTTLFALLGSLISRQEDAAQVMMPVFVPLMAGYFVGQAAVFGDAESLWVKILTWFPLTSPLVLPVRVARAAIGPVELIGSIALVTATIYGLIRLAGRVYEFTLLRTGSRVGWGELVRLSRGSIVD